MSRQSSDALVPGKSAIETFNRRPLTNAESGCVCCSYALFAIARYFIVASVKKTCR